MKKTIIALALCFTPALVIAGGHAGFGGHGTAVRSDANTTEATSGSHAQITTKDVWIYDNPAEGFHVAQKATCHYFQVFATGKQQPSGGTATCQAIDPDGDISLWNGIFQSNGTLAFSVITGTGKWAALAGAKFEGKTRKSLEGASVYDFAPLN